MLNFLCQSEAISQLKLLKEYNRQSILIEGCTGCGKTYLAGQFASMVGVSDFQIVEPKVDAIRKSIETCIQLNEPIVLCIENLDCGVPAASYSLLKFLEEPYPKVYIVVTCRNIRNIPDTIISRSAVVTIAPPTDWDLAVFGSNVDSSKLSTLSKTAIWKCARTFSDVSTIFNMNQEQLSYFATLSNLNNSKDSVSSIVWKLGHYEDNSETPVEIAIRYIMNDINLPFVNKCGIECIRDLNSGRVAQHAILAKFVFNLKYCE